jgi:Uma2 family endonuclease
MGEMGGSTMTERAMPVLLEPDDLLRLPDGDHYELIDGVPKAKEKGAATDEIGLYLGSLLVAFVRSRKLGHIFGPQTGYVCFPDDPKRLRLPDVSFVAAGRLEGGKAPEGHIKIAPDIAVEVISPNNLYEEIETKVADYRSAGVKLIWIVNPKTRTVLIRRLDGSCAEVGATGQLSGEDVLPGFTCPVADLFV